MAELEVAREVAEHLLSAASHPAALIDARLQVLFANRAFRHRVPDADGALWVGRIAARSGGDNLEQRVAEAVTRLVEAREFEAAELPIEPLAPQGGVLRISSQGRGCRWATLELIEAAEGPAGTPEVDDRDALAGALHDLGQPLQTLSLLHGILATKLKHSAELDLLRGMEQCASAISGMLQSLGAEISPAAHSGTAEMSELPVADVLTPLSSEFAYHAWVHGVRWRAVVGRAKIRSNRALLVRLLRRVLAQALGEQQHGGTVLLGARRRGRSLVIEIWTSGAAAQTQHSAGSALDVVPAPDRASGRLLHSVARGGVQVLAEQLDVSLEVRRRARNGLTVRVVVPSANVLQERERASLPTQVIGSIGEVATGGGTPPKSRELDRDWVIFIVDDDRALSHAMHRALQHRFLVRSFNSAEAFLHALDAEQGEVRGCLLVDLHLPGMDGFQLLETVRNRQPMVSCIMITAHGEVRWAVRAMQSGAIDFVEKPINLEALLATLQRAREQARNAKAPPKDDASEIVSSLTSRQREIMRIVVHGQTNREAAELLGLSQRTVENHRYEIMRRTGSETFSDLVRLALRARIL